MSIPETETLNNFVSRIFRIEDVTLGEPARGLIARYRGQLIGEDSAAALPTSANAITTAMRRAFIVPPSRSCDAGMLARWPGNLHTSTRERVRACVRA